MDKQVKFTNLPIEYTCDQCGRKKTIRIKQTTYFPKVWVCPRCKSTMHCDVDEVTKRIQEDKDARKFHTLL